MNTKFKILASVILVLALVSDVIWLMTADGTNNTGPLFFFGATLLFIIGSALYAKSKGYSAMLGAFGVFNLLGFIIVAAIVSHFEYNKKKEQINEQ